MIHYRMIIFVLLFATISYSMSLLFLTSAYGTPIVGENMPVDKSTINDSSPKIQYSSMSDKVRVVASFYPILEFVKKVGGDRVEVTSLIPVGIEPHDFDPTIQQIQNAQSADMVVFNGAGLEGERLLNMNANFVLDTSKGLNLTTASNEHTDDGGSPDPHIWLDPLLAKQQVEQIRDGLIRIDPRNAE